MELILITFFTSVVGILQMRNMVELIFFQKKVNGKMS